MKCTFDVKYYCDGCGERHSTYVQYSRELADPPDNWDTYNDGRQDTEVKNLIGKTFACKEFPRHLTKIHSVDELTIYRTS